MYNIFPSKMLLLTWFPCNLVCSFLLLLSKSQFHDQILTSRMCLFQALCSGVFELRLKSFDNRFGKDSVGQCCSGERTEHCVSPCRTRFRICLKHYQAKIDTTSPCTFGDVITPVLGENSVKLSDSKLEEFKNPIRFNFDFTWPVSTLLNFTNLKCWIS